jgi:hypothetical protein
MIKYLPQTFASHPFSCEIPVEFAQLEIDFSNIKAIYLDLELFINRKRFDNIKYLQSQNKYYEKITIDCLSLYLQR